MISSGILYNADNASLLYIKKREYLYLTVEGFVRKETLEMLTNALIKGITETTVRRIIFDTSKIKVIKKEDIALFLETITPILDKRSVRKIVFINSDDIFGNKSVELLASCLNSKIPTKIFSNMERAELWLFN